MQDNMIESYLNQEKGEKSNSLRDIIIFYENSTSQFSNLLILANPSEHWWQRSSSV